MTVSGLYGCDSLMAQTFAARPCARDILNLVVFFFCFGFNGPLRQYLSLYRAVSQRKGDRGEKE